MHVVLALLRLPRCGCVMCANDENNKIIAIICNEHRRPVNILAYIGIIRRFGRNILLLIQICEKANRNMDTRSTRFIRKYPNLFDFSVQVSDLNGTAAKSQEKTSDCIVVFLCNFLSHLDFSRYKAYKAYEVYG